jgi:hypothetical protein
LGNSTAIPIARKVLVVTAVLLLTGCAPSNPPPTATHSSGTSGNAGTKANTAQTITSTNVGWFAGNHVTVTGAEFDPKTEKATVHVTVANTATRDSFDDDVTDSVSLDTGEGAPLAVSRVSSLALQSATTKLDLEFVAPAEGLVLKSAVLQLGAPNEQRWLVPLDPTKKATGREPVSLPITGVLDAAGFAFTISKVEVLPWACSQSDTGGPSSSGRVGYEPTAGDKLGLVLWGDITEARSIVGGDTLDSTTLLQPDGTTVAQIGEVLKVFDLGDRVDDYALCFTVDSPAAGNYSVTWTSYLKAATATFTFTVPNSIG